MIDIKSVNPTDPITIARLISELEGVSYEKEREKVIKAYV